ncbi:MAG TPA: hypothetical protein VMP01_12515 [Pirellulaceae bacterium]|nr:hypothetical protein [Pirellulaceae bacterium]
MTSLASWAAPSRLFLLAASLLAVLSCLSGQASGQISGRAIAQPYFDHDWHARFDHCRWRPVYWGFDPFATVGEDCQDEETGTCRYGFVAHRPNAWYVAADFVPMTFDWSHDLELARFGEAGDTALSTSDLDVEFDSGMRITVGRTLGGCYQVEGIYQGIYSWDDTAAAASPDGIQDFTNFLDAFTTETGTQASTSIFAKMQSAEVNFRAWLDMPPGPFDVQLLVGARYMNINEDLRFGIDEPASNVLVQTNNDLWGVQLGVDLKWLVHPRAYIHFDGKGAICHNNASLATALNGAGDVAAGDRTAFVGDLLLTANWQMTPSWSIRAGYQAIFVHGVAISADNLAANAALLDAGEPVDLDDRGEVVYHGPVLGVMWAR